jgi:hypothetical protein
MVTQFTSLPEGEEGRLVDFFMEIGMDATNTFFKNANVNDVISAIEAQEDRWPPSKLRELASRLHNMASGL